MRFKTLAIVALAFMLGLAPETVTLSQEECPTRWVCVEYADRVFEIDPAQGALQAFVTSVSETFTQDLTGERITHHGQATLFRRRGNTYVPDPVAEALTAAQAEVAEIGDPLVLRLAK